MRPLSLDVLAFRCLKMTLALRLAINPVTLKEATVGPLQLAVAISNRGVLYHLAFILDAALTLDIFIFKIGIIDEEF